MVDLLVSKGASVNATDYHGLTALHLSCQKGYQGVTVSVYFKYICLQPDTCRILRFKKSAPVNMIEKFPTRRCLLSTFGRSLRQPFANSQKCIRNSCLIMTAVMKVVTGAKQEN